MERFILTVRRQILEDVPTEKAFRFTENDRPDGIPPEEWKAVIGLNIYDPRDNKLIAQTLGSKVSMINIDFVSGDLQDPNFILMDKFTN